jgi:DNA-binding NarL/FixJ family response regulator
MSLSTQDWARIVLLQTMDSEPGYPELTPEETRVLGLRADGMRTVAIAAELGISEQTVTAHIVSVLRKLRNRPDAGYWFDTDELPET